MLQRSKVSPVWQRFTIAHLFLWGGFVLAVPGIGQDNWRGFRGDGSGIVRADLPVEWSPDENVAWRTELPGYGQSAPVIWGENIYLTSTDGPFQQSLRLHAVSLTSGEFHWSKEFTATTRVENYFRNSRAAPTCAVDEQAVYTFFASGDVTAFDHHGDQLWTLSLFERFGQVDNERGTASSPAQTDSHLIIVIDHEGPSYLAAIEKATGEVSWTVDRGQRVASWSSPVVARFDEFELIIISSSDTVDAYDANTGELYWSIEGLVGNHIPSASVVEGRVYVGSTEMYRGLGDPDKIAASNSCIQLTLDQGRPSYEVLWGAERANSYYSSPLAFAGFVYYVNKAGVLFCVDQQGGEQVFGTRIGNPCWASAIGVENSNGDRFVYLFAKNGFTTVIRPGQEYERVARNQLWDVSEMREAEAAAERLRRLNRVPNGERLRTSDEERALDRLPEGRLHEMFGYGDPTIYGVGVAKDSLLIRTGQHLYCVRQEE